MSSASRLVPEGLVPGVLIKRSKGGVMLSVIWVIFGWMWLL